MTINKKIRIRIDLLAITTVFALQIIQCFISFRNVYIYDLQKDIEAILNKKSNAKIYIDSKEFHRLSAGGSSNKKTVSFDSNAIYTDQVNIIMDYINSKYDLYYISSIIPSRQVNNNLKIRTSGKALKEIEHFIRNKNKTKSISLFRFEPFSYSLHLESDVILFPNTTTYFFSKNDFVTKNTVKDTDNGFIVSGKRSDIFLNKKIYTSFKKCNTFFRIKNIGTIPTRLFVGFTLFTRNNMQVSRANYPYKSNKPVHVISSHINSNKILVDAPFLWEKDCFISTEGNDNSNDTPSFTLLNETVFDVKKESDYYIITLNKPLSTPILPGSKIRINGKNGSFFTNIIVIQPGDEIIIDSTVSTDKESNEYSTNSLTKSIDLICPFIYSHSMDLTQENQILIKDYALSFQK